MFLIFLKISAEYQQRLGEGSSGQNRLILLVLTIDEKIFKPMSIRANLIKDILLPRTVKELKTFIGCISYYHWLTNKLSAPSTTLQELLYKTNNSVEYNHKKH